MSLPHLLRVCRTQQLEAGTRYDDGFDEDSPVIKHLWEVLHEFTNEDKKKFLFFCTGSDRVPIKGLGSLKFTISRSGPDSDRCVCGVMWCNVTPCNGVCVCVCVCVCMCVCVCVCVCCLILLPLCHSLFFFISLSVVLTHQCHAMSTGCPCPTLASITCYYLNTPPKKS